MPLLSLDNGFFQLFPLWFVSSVPTVHVTYSGQAFEKKLPKELVFGKLGSYVIEDVGLGVIKGDNLNSVSFYLEQGNITV